MGLQPIDHKAQVQCLTTALKNICRDYPAGGSVLHELLQNADDAGATTVRFIVDERTHPAGQLINPKLGQYQGPALLAYNNAVFTDADFTNLASLGDSQKQNDGSTTGRFGRGFNSVYNWTDAPVIVSRDRLLFLDPHTEWSEGGPVYDFVANSSDASIKNHMAAFQSVMENTTQRLEGTVIRIPLRTEERAKKSKIWKSAITVSQIDQVLQLFASEFGRNGLLFMRNVERLEIGSRAGSSIQIELVGGDTIRLHKSKINGAVRSFLNNPEYSFDYAFDTDIEYRSAGQIERSSFAIHHSIAPVSKNCNLREWAERQKLIPWVAVAVPKEDTKTQGSLFSVLPLPIPTHQPAHVHGLFSISPDRGKLYQPDKRNQDQTPARWNDWLMQGPVPAAWVKLLIYLTRSYPRYASFQRWPQIIHAALGPLGNIAENLIRIIDEECLAIWPTVIGYVPVTRGLLATGAEPAELREALREGKIPVVYVPPQLQERAATLFKDRILCPQSLCSFLKYQKAQTRLWSDQTKHKTLEYLISKPGFIDYDGLELFPFRDGMYRSIGEGSVFVHRDKFEESLFHLDDSRNLDLNKLSESAQSSLKRGCEDSTAHPSIRYRSADSLRDYCVRYIFNDISTDQEMVKLGEETAEFVLKAWTWISTHRIDILDDAISGLWLLPLSNGLHRNIRPSNPSQQVYFAPVGEIGELMWRFDARLSQRPLPLLRTGPAGATPGTHIIIGAPMRSLYISDASSTVSFLQWLRQTLPFLGGVEDEEKHTLVRIVASRLTGIHASEREDISEALRTLTIFQRIAWNPVGNDMQFHLAWTSLDSSRKSIGLCDGIGPVPNINGTQFLVVDRSARKILRALKLADCLNTVQVLESHVIPAWASGQESSWTYSCKEQVAESILRQFSRLSLISQAKLRALAVVPVARLNGEETSRFSLAAALFDPAVPELRGLCFDDEGILPKQAFFQDFSAALWGCGLTSRLDEAAVEHRVRCYAEAKHPSAAIRERAQRLLQSECSWRSPPEPLECVRRLAWLPAVDPDGTLSLRSAGECRGSRDRLLVDSQLSIVNVSISPEWNRRLGWDDDLSGQTLVSQLKHGIQRKDRQIVDAVLAYISEKRIAESVADALMNLPCIISSNGRFVLPTQAFRPPDQAIRGCEGLEPYLVNAERRFWDEHETLMTRLKVGDRPQVHDLLEVQSTLEAKRDLGEPDVSVAIEILNHASRFPREMLAGLKVISISREFYPLGDINLNDLGVLKPKETANLTHPEIPLGTIRKLGIGMLSEKLIKGMLEIEDEDDEFEQQESVTTRIADTLERYTVESTFREYLANADDAQGASQISWLLDERTHPGHKLLTPELAQLQGPALLTYNDGTFSENDFRGLKNVGEGSKARNKESIGQFGRGSQTMYHWTDVPMILSGEYLLVLDPCRGVLTRNRITGKRMPGLKLKLSKLRHACPDQLAPFEGLWGYTSSLDSYAGTIFRFPLRADNRPSALVPRTRILNSQKVFSLLDDYFDEARVSLLFLRRVKSASFGVHESPNSGWAIRRRLPIDEGARSFSELVACEVKKGLMTGKDTWWVAIEDLTTPPADYLPESSRRMMKNVECGIAALISTSAATKPILSRSFSTLPLAIPSDLPVHIHATFSLSGDRQSIAIDEYGQQSHGSKWNRYLLQVALPRLYLAFLEDVGTQVRQRLFEFWPREEPPKRSCAELLCASFWEQLPKSSRRIFSKAQPDGESRHRRAADLLDINQAVFDFLPLQQSDILAGVLISMDVNLVRHIPAEISRRLKAVQPKVKSVNGSVLRQLFKSDTGRTCLLNESTKRPRIMETIFRHAIPVEDELTDLDGCHLLPLADGSLATFRHLGRDNEPSPKYYLSSRGELDLFIFASECFVDPVIGIWLRPVLASGKYNLASFQLCHVERLLRMRPAIPTPNPEADKWLADFWDFWNGSPDAEALSSDITKSCAQIFRSTREGHVNYASPTDFKSFPAVVEPSILEHQQLCDKIPGLYHFAPKLMPKVLMNSEISLHTKDSFSRLIRALSTLSKPPGVGKFVEQHLVQADLKVLRELIVTHLSSQPLTTKPEWIPSVKSIPLWPCYRSSAGQLIHAGNALIAADQKLLAPWIKDGHQFLEPQFCRDRRNSACLMALGAMKVSAEVLLKDYVLPLPADIGSTGWENFTQLIAAVAASTIPPAALQEHRIAADGTRTLRKACELYDHEDRIFASAFRLQTESRFVEGSTKQYRSFWLRIGLRHRVDSLVDPVDYLQCLQVIKLRLQTQDRHEDPHLEQDTREVLSLLTAPSASTQRFTVRDWAAIAQERVFASRTRSAGIEYRQHAMTLVASKQPVLCLSKIISSDHIGVCWSQAAFPAHPPIKEVLSKIPSKGEPTIDIVWQHLAQMKHFAQGLERHQMRDFLADLSHTYQYLQDHLSENVAQSGPKQNAVWLNLNTLDHSIALLSDIKSSWHTTGELVLSSAVDAGRVKAVKPGLMRYEKLLRAIGCSSVIYPTVASPERQIGVSLSTALQQLRRNRVLTDIEFSTEGQSIHAHRAVLAAKTGKYATQFNGKWVIDKVIQYDRSTDSESFLSYRTISAMIHYAYEEDIKWSAMEVSEDDDATAKATKLELLLDLHKGADSWVMPDLASQIQEKILLAVKSFLNLENVLRVQERAGEARAKAVEQWCTKFIEDNQPTLQNVHPEMLR